MTTNILLAGVGGQGILTIAAILDIAALNNGLFFKQSEVHGMSQRGGAVQSHVRLSDSEIYSDLIPKGKADLILGTEPMETLRYIPYLKKGGWIITDSKPFLNIDNYPQEKELFDEISSFTNHHILDASKIAKKVGNARASNLVLLGAACHIVPMKERALIAAIKTLFSKKGNRIVGLNIKAFEAGKDLVCKESFAS